MEFSENQQSLAASEPVYRELSVSIIAPGCSIEGNVTAEKGISILGFVAGDVFSKSGLLHVGDAGRIHGGIDGQDVLLDGKVEGNVLARGTLTINGYVRGDIQYGTIRIGEDANLDGCRIQRIRRESVPGNDAANVVPISHAAKLEGTVASNG